MTEHQKRDMLDVSFLVFLVQRSKCHLCVKWNVLFPFMSCWKLSCAAFCSLHGILNPAVLSFAAAQLLSRIQWPTWGVKDTICKGSELLLCNVQAWKAANVIYDHQLPMYPTFMIAKEQPPPQEHRTKTKQKNRVLMIWHDIIVTHDEQNDIRSKKPCWLLEGHQNVWRGAEHFLQKSLKQKTTVVKTNWFDFSLTCQMYTYLLKI